MGIQPASGSCLTVCDVLDGFCFIFWNFVTELERILLKCNIKIFPWVASFLLFVSDM